MEAVSPKIPINRTPNSRINEVDFDNLPFGKVFSDHMMVADYVDGKWQNPRIEPYGPITFAPCITSLHYGQSIFEGMKAFKNSNGDSQLFRPLENHKRFNASAARMCMPEIPEDIFMEGLTQLIALDKDWIPEEKGSALYIRPFMFGTDEAVGIKPSDTYKFMIFSCPVGPYYPEPVKLWVEEKLVRAFSGGTGEAKAAGNYAGSLLGAKIAKENGFDQSIWLDGVEHKYIEECGTMNIFFVIDGVAITPELQGTVLRGITRSSAIQVLQDKGIKVEERPISIYEIVEAHQKGTLQDCFGTGTAATIAPVDKIGYKDIVIQFDPVESRTISQHVLTEMEGMRYGGIEDRHNWMLKV